MTDSPADQFAQKLFDLLANEPRLNPIADHADEIVCICNQLIIGLLKTIDPDIRGARLPAYRGSHRRLAPLRQRKTRKGHAAMTPAEFEQKISAVKDAQSTILVQLRVMHWSGWSQELAQRLKTAQADHTQAISAFLRSDSEIGV
jgi:hypothetical protein